MSSARYLAPLLPLSPINVNMASQFRACSFNKLNMIPHGGDNYNNAPGVITITGVVSLESNSRNAIRNDCISKANAKTGVNLASTNEWDHVIFVLQKCYVGKYVFRCEMCIVHDHVSSNLTIISTILYFFCRLWLGCLCWNQ